MHCISKCVTCRSREVIFYSVQYRSDHKWIAASNLVLPNTWETWTCMEYVQWRATKVVGACDIWEETERNSFKLKRRLKENLSYVLNAYCAMTKKLKPGSPEKRPAVGQEAWDFKLCVSLPLGFALALGYEESWKSIDFPLRLLTNSTVHVEGAGRKLHGLTAWSVSLGLRNGKEVTSFSVNTQCFSFSQCLQFYQQTMNLNMQIRVYSVLRDSAILSPALSKLIEY